MLILQMISYPIHSLVIILHICNFTMVTTRKRLRRSGNWFLASLSLSDLLFVFLAMFNCHSSNPNCINANDFLRSVTRFSYTVSIMSTLGISVDRYLFVEYSLRYRNIVTNKRALVSIILIWVSSAIIATVSSVVSTVTNNWMYFYIPQYIIRLTFSIIIFTFAIYIQYIRNKHERSITLRRRYFGVEEEHLSILQLLKASVEGIVRLNITSVVLYLSDCILRVVFRHGLLKGNPTVLILFRIMVVIYITTNPFLYIFLIVDLRIEYKNVFRQFCCAKNRVSQQNTGSLDSQRVQGALDNQTTVVANTAGGTNGSISCQEYTDVHRPPNDFSQTTEEKIEPQQSLNIHGNKDHIEIAEDMDGQKNAEVDKRLNGKEPYENHKTKQESHMPCTSMKKLEGGEAKANEGIPHVCRNNSAQKGCKSHTILVSGAT